MDAVALGGIMDSYGMPAQELQDLTKALGTGTLVNGSLGESYVAGGAPFRVQSLEGVLKVVTYQDRNIVFWKDIPKQQAYNTVEEYNLLTSYGGTGSGFFKEGGLPQEDDSVYTRQSKLVKFMGTTGIVTHALTLVRSAHGDLIGRAAKDRTLALLKQVELGLFKGDSTLNPEAWDGLEKQIVDAGSADNIVDLRGAAMDEDVMENIAQVVADNYGYLTTLYAGNRTLTDLGKQILPNGRFQLPFGDKEGRLGYRVRFFDAQVGSYELKPNVFLKPGKAMASIVANANAPVAPVIPVLDASADDAASKFTSTATQFFAVTAVNTAGESQPSPVASVSVAAGKKVSITITNVAGATAYAIYRGTTADNLKEMVTVPATAGASTIVFDLNADLPGTAKAYGVMLDQEQGLSFKQLAPLMKMDLATIAASYRFMLLLYGVPIVYAPLKFVLIKNIGAL